MALPRSSLVGRPLGGPPPGCGEARLKPCAVAAEGLGSWAHARACAGVLAVDVLDGGGARAWARGRPERRHVCL